MRPAVLPPASEGVLASAGEACGAALATCCGGAAARAVPAEAEPVEPVDDGGYRFLRGPRAVGILDAQEELAAVMARK